ncbi:MAG TPA: hypothetical protein ENI66_02305 [Candidatus Yonathbacteria bacterium]|nr:hypothetical protein [Candidatus Yonathbacteria bacterium]
MSNFDDRFLKLLENRKRDYKTWVPIYCLAMREYVFFGMRGFNHLRFKIDNSPRSPSETMYKLGLIPLIRPAIHLATVVEKYERRISPVGGSHKKVLKEMEYWAVESIVGKSNARIRVVLRRLIGSKQVHFWSVMKLNDNQKSPSVADEDD